MKLLHKGMLSIAILAALPGTALAGSPSYQGTFEVEGMRNVSYHPSEYTEWADITGPQNHQPWTPSVAEKVAIYEADLGVVWQGDEKDVDVSDFMQSRDYTTDQERYEQLMQLETSSGLPIRVGEPIRYTRTDERIEDRVVDAITGTWGGQSGNSTPTCGSWVAYGSNTSVYLTPYTQQTGQRRECTWPQIRTAIYNTGSEAVTFTQTREYHYWETKTTQGLLNNRSCNTIKSFYSANSGNMKGFTYNGWKRLDLSSSLSYTTYCRDGYSLVAAQRESSPKVWTGSGYSTNLANNWSRGFTLPQSWIPSHSTWAVGRDTSLKLKFNSGQYTTGNINQWLYVGGTAMRVHRSTGNHYRYHNARTAVHRTEAQYNNTLTVEDSTYTYGSNYRWAFSPHAYAACTRGYALSGNYSGSSNGFAWTIWVK